MYEVKNDIVLKLLTKVTIIRDIVNVRLSETHAPGYFNFVLFFSNFIEMLYMYHNNTLIMLSCETTSYCFHICYICTCADSNFLPCLKKYMDNIRVTRRTSILFYAMIKSLFWNMIFFKWYQNQLSVLSYHFCNLT